LALPGNGLDDLLMTRFESLIPEQKHSNCFVNRVNPELVKDVLDVVAYGRIADVQFVRNGVKGFIAGETLEYLCFAGGQIRSRSRRPGRIAGRNPRHILFDTMEALLVHYAVYHVGARQIRIRARDGNDFDPTSLNA
jgi:hypothetical protein